MTPNHTTSIGMLVGGDVMTGRGIDQVLPHPANPILYEPTIRDARAYVRLAERANGPIPQPVDGVYLWGDALAALHQAEADVRLINLETSITVSEDAWPGKTIHYRTHPRNSACLTAARIDCCCLANNHVLDWGYAGLRDTLAALDRLGIAHAGAGPTAAHAATMAALTVPGKGRVFVCALGSPTSGIPHEWGASPNRPGVNLLEDLSDETARRIARQIRAAAQPSDVTVASIHWGGNWGDAIPETQIRFAHRLIEGGIALVHGHSSHHVKALEVYQEHLILYGCGDVLDDYEGIGGYEAFRPDLRLLYLVRMDPQHGRLMEVRLIPLQIRQFCLHRAGETDVTWLRDRLNRLGAPFGTQVQVESDACMTLRWQHGR